MLIPVLYSCIGRYFFEVFQNNNKLNPVRCGGKSRRNPNTQHSSSSMIPNIRLGWGSVLTLIIFIYLHSSSRTNQLEAGESVQNVILEESMNLLKQITHRSPLKSNPPSERQTRIPTNDDQSRAIYKFLKPHPEGHLIQAHISGNNKNNPNYPNRRLRERFRRAVTTNDNFDETRRRRPKRHEQKELFRIDSNESWQSSNAPRSSLPNPIAAAAASALGRVGLAKSRRGPLSRADHSANSLDDLDAGGGFTVPSRAPVSPLSTTSQAPDSLVRSSSPVLSYDGPKSNDNNGLAMASSVPIGGVAGHDAASLVFENPTISNAVLASNLIDSYDTDHYHPQAHLGVGGSGAGMASHYDFAYQSLAPARVESQFSISDIPEQSPSGSAYGANGNSTLALYRLLNFIDNSGAPSSPALSPQLVPVSFQNSKGPQYASSSSQTRPISTAAALGVGGAIGRFAGSPPLNGLGLANSINNFDNYNNYYYHTNGGDFNSSRSAATAAASSLNHLANISRHAHNHHHNNQQAHLAHLFASQDKLNHHHHNQQHDRDYYQQKLLLNSMPDHHHHHHHHHWSRRRNPQIGQATQRQQHNWHQQDLSNQAASDLDLFNNGPNPATSGPAGYQLAQQQQVNKNLLLADNMIEVQPAAMKLAKLSSSSYANLEPRRSNNYSSSSHHHHHQNLNIRNHYPEMRPTLGGGAAGGGGSGMGNGGGPAGVFHNADNFNNGGSSPNSNSFNYNATLNSMLNGNGNLNDDDIGFGHKQPQAMLALNGKANGNGGGGGINAMNAYNNSEKLSGALTLSSSSTNSKVPQDADSQMIASNNAPRCDKFTPDICVDDFEYPEQAIIDEIEKKRNVFELMYSEVKDNEPLVDGIPRDVEESYNYDYYYHGKSNLSQAASFSQPTTLSAATNSNQVGAGLRLSSGHPKHARSPQQSLPSPYNSPGGDLDGGPLMAGASLSPVTVAPAASSATNAADAANDIDGMDALIGATPQASNVAATTAANQQQLSPSSQSSSPPTAGYICPSEVMYGKPKLAKNRKGLWKVIVNAGEFTQTVRLEKCLFPNKKCNFVSAQSYESRCAQVHSYHRLLVFEKGRGFYIDTFRLPTGCNCYVSKKPFASSSQASSSSSLSSMPPSALAGGGSSSTGDRRRDGSTIGGAEGHPDGGERSLNTPASRPAGSRILPIGDSSAGGNERNGGHRAGNSQQSSANNRASSSESMLSQTLWSILSGGGAGGGNSGFSNGLYNLNQFQPQQPYHQAGPVSSSLASWNQMSQSAQGNGMPAAGHIPQEYQHEPAAASYLGANSHGHSNLNQNGYNHHHHGHGLSAPSSPLSSSLFGYQRQVGSSGAHQSQSMILEHLSQNPSLAANISDSVLRQLIDVGQIGASGSNGVRSISSVHA